MSQPGPSEFVRATRVGMGPDDGWHAHASADHGIRQPKGHEALERKHPRRRYLETKNRLLSSCRPSETEQYGLSSSPSEAEQRLPPSYQGEAGGGSSPQKSLARSLSRRAGATRDPFDRNNGPDRRFKDPPSRYLALTENDFALRLLARPGARPAAPTSRTD